MTFNNRRRKSAIFYILPLDKIRKSLYHIDTMKGAARPRGKGITMTTRKTVQTVLQNIFGLHAEGVAWREMFQDARFYTILKRTAENLNVAPLEIENIVSLAVACFDADYSSQQAQKNFYVFTTPRGGAVVVGCKAGMRALIEVAHFDGATFDIYELNAKWRDENIEIETVWGEYIQYYFDDIVNDYTTKIEGVL